MVIPEDEYKRENTDDTIVPDDFIPVNESYHHNPFDTGSQWSQFTLNTLPAHHIPQSLDLLYGL